MNFSSLLEQIIKGDSLEETQAYNIMCQILSGELSPEKISALLTSLRCKGETYDEVIGFVKAMRQFAIKIETSKKVVDTCGTGGDGAHTFNISTTAAFIASGAGVPIAKHHNRSVSSRCGSADVLEALGVNISLSPEKVKKSVEEIGMGFCFAPIYHQSMKFAAPVRKELGIRTVFNMLGPLLNPFLAKRQVIGVFAPELTEFFAKILQRMGSEHSYIIHGENGLDEFTLCGRTKITEMKNGTITTKFLSPADFGFQNAAPATLTGGDKKENAKILIDILSNKKGPKRNISILNAGLAIACSDLTDSIETGVKLAEESINSGAALKKLNELITFSNNS